jgi:hypothetical protein
MLIPCLIAVPTMIAANAYASRCVDSVDLFAQHINVSIGAPIPKKMPGLDPDLGREPGRPAAIPPPAGIAAPMPSEASMESARATQIPGASRPPASHKFNGKELKAHAKAVLSSLLNAALAAGEEGRSWSCFKKLNFARAVVLDPASNAWAGEDRESDWR